MREMILEGSPKPLHLSVNSLIFWPLSTAESHSPYCDVLIFIFLLF